MAATEDVYCTLLMSDSYLPGAAVLAHSLRDSGTKKKIACLCTVDSLLYNTLTELKELFDYIIPVEKISNPSLENLARLDRLDLRFAFTKIALWRQEQFRKIVYIDADVVALRAPDELFDLEDSFAAALDIGWPDCFNSGVMLLKPNAGDFWSLQTLAASGVSFDGADQGLLNDYFASRPWKRLSFTYNCTPSSGYQYEPAYRHFRSSISMAHFIGKTKPWSQGREALSASSSGVYKELLGRWWSVYDRHYKATDSASGSGGAAATVKFYVKGDQAQTVVPRGGKNQSLGQGPAKSPTTEQRRFSAPRNEWDATRMNPPSHAKPEASNFPSSRYDMSSDTGLFRPPRAYPEPPKDMYYDIPPTKPSYLEDRPKPIFPWEQKAIKPTRVFTDDSSTSNTHGTEATSELPMRREKIDDQFQRPVTPSEQTSGQSIPWQSFARTNAWDDNSQIEQYVRTVKQSQSTRSQTGHIRGMSSVDISSPSIPSQQKRRESLILTDFPQPEERPSLPVTPAPMARPTFWGEERNTSGNLPTAEGVPNQSDWNPLERLEQLRRDSVQTTNNGPQSPPKEVPLRELLATAAPIPMAVVSPSEKPRMSAEGLSTAAPAAAAQLANPDAGPAPSQTLQQEEKEKKKKLDPPAK